MSNESDEFSAWYAKEYPGAGFRDVIIRAYTEQGWMARAALASSGDSPTSSGDSGVSSGVSGSSSGGIQPMPIPPRWKVLPPEPTKEMQKAGREANDLALECWHDRIEGDASNCILQVYKAFLATAPACPAFDATSVTDERISDVVGNLGMGPYSVLSGPIEILGFAHRVLALAAAPVAEPADIMKTLRNLLDYAERQICPHDETYRGGGIWTICRSCDRMWADDLGGFKPDPVPPAILAARHALYPTTQAGESK